MYVYIWRVTIFFYIYRIKTLLPLSFWRSEKIFDGITAVSTDREDIIFSFMLFLFTPEDLFQIVVVFSLKVKTISYFVSLKSCVSTHTVYKYQTHIPYLFIRISFKSFVYRDYTSSWNIPKRDRSQYWWRGGKIWETLFDSVVDLCVLRTHRTPLVSDLFTNLFNKTQREFPGWKKKPKNRRVSSWNTRRVVIRLIRTYFFSLQPDVLTEHGMVPWHYLLTRKQNFFLLFVFPPPLNVFVI
jgi:hypothetical protein